MKFLVKLMKSIKIKKALLLELNNKIISIIITKYTCLKIFKKLLVFSINT